MTILRAISFALVLLCSAVSAQDFESESGKLLQSSSKKLEAAVENFAKFEDERVVPTLKHLLNAELYYKKENNELVVVIKDAGKVLMNDLLSGEAIAELDSKDIKKIRINNRVRRALKKQIAFLELKSEDKDVRLAAAKNLVVNPDKDSRDLIVEVMEEENYGKAKDYMRLSIALIDINGGDDSLKLEAVKVLGESVEPQAVGTLRRLAKRDESGAFVEANKELAGAAEAALKRVNSKLGFFKFSENFLFGLSLGSILLLAAIGLAITFGVMGVINMAHGEMIMLGAYTTFAVQQIFPGLIDISLLIAIPAAFLVSGLMGVLIERLVIQHLYGRPLDTLLATFGISLILQQCVKMYSTNNVSVVSPEWIRGFWEVNGALSLTYNRIYILIFSLVVLGVLALVLKKTMAGLQMRAVTQNRAMANSMGIRSGWVDAMTFGLGSGIAGIAGVALSQITTVGPFLGQTYIVDSFMVVVFGGVGNLLGTFFGAMTLGIANKFIEPYAGAVVAKIVMLVFIILFIQWRPRGLFALKGRFVED